MFDWFKRLWRSTFETESQQEYPIGSRLYPALAGQIMDDQLKVEDEKKRLQKEFENWKEQQKLQTQASKYENESI